jgi:cobalt-zinc-cadmium efflux system protein
MQVTDRLNKAFTIGIAVNILYVVVEMAAGIWFNSLALISDAGHNLTDVLSLVLAMVAYKLAARPSTNQFTYGFRKSTILVSLINSVFLFIAIGIILWESIDRISHPVELNGTSIAITASIGIVINGITAFLFFKDQSRDLNVRGAYLHMLADAAVSLGVVVSGLFIMWFKIYWIDLVASLIVVGVIFYSTWHLFKDSLFLALDGVPSDIDLDKVTDAICSIEGVEECHHLHVWGISTTQNALTAHVVIASNSSMEELATIRQNIKKELLEMDIHHATLEFETASENCNDTHTDAG